MLNVLRALPATACALALGAAPALAQTRAPGEPSTAQQDCQAEPVPEGGTEVPAPSDDATAKLDKCNGVLQPPPTGDGEIREPAPDGGKTPVITPGALPEQPPSQG